MKSTAHLSSARVYSILMLLAVYLAFNLATSYARRVGLLQEARHAFAIEFLRSNFAVEYLSANAGPISVRQIPGAGSVEGTWREPNQEAEQGEWFPAPTSQPSWLVSVKRSTGRRWESLVHVAEVARAVDERASPQREAEPPVTTKEPASNAATPSGALATLRRIALELGLKDFDQKAYNLILRDIEQELVDREVTVPGIDLAFRSDRAPWIISILTIGLLLLIRNQVSAVLRDKELALDEPWIIVDNSSGLERLVAAGWLIAIWLAPWIVTGCLLVIVSGTVVADGGIASTLRSTVAPVAVMVLVLLGGWASLTTTVGLLRLRRLRQDRLRELLISSSSTIGFE